ncbi:MAG TPA: hypothetical protein PK122_01745 [Candidatus Paceibacterota bacterium]|jgi:hypothetical protein|nr:hypothetical protein [Candidatus Paceibacterota bacterium]
MAYLHCHTKDCHWSQDDFWNYRFNEWKAWKKFFLLKWTSRPFGYNPLSILLEDIAEYIKPRYIKMDSSWIREMGLNVKENKVFSWWFIKDGFKRYFRVKKNMLYKTEKEFRKANEEGIAFCPKCGQNNWDID